MKRLMLLLIALSLLLSGCGKVEDNTSFDPREELRKYQKAFHARWNWIAAYEKNRFEFDGDEGVMHYNTLRGEKKMPFGMAKNVFFQFPEKHYYDHQINLPSGREHNAFASAEWLNESTLHIRTYVDDNCMGNMHTYVTFDGNKIGIKMTKEAEWFMDEYQGEAYGKRK